MSRVIQLRFQKYAIETIKTRVPGGLCILNSNPTTSTKTASEYLQGRFSYFIYHSPACTCHHGGAQPPFLSSVQAAKWDSLEQLLLFTARGGFQVLDIQPVVNIPLRKKRRGICVND